MTQAETRFFTFGTTEKPFGLSCGASLPQVTVAYETYGQLNRAKNNAVLLFHAMTGSQHAAGYNPAVAGVKELWNKDCHLGWWDEFIGSGKALDTKKNFVICANYIGGCYGGSGPTSLNPATKRPYGSQFPAISAADIVASQVRLLDELGIDRLHAVVGGSTGGLLSLLFATLHPERVGSVILIACGASVTTLQRIHIFEQACAIEADPNFLNGDYYSGKPPTKGLALARMISHKTFVSLRTLSQRAKHQVLSNGSNFAFFRMDNTVESYMFHQGLKFVKRFDANSYLRILDMWQRFNLASDAGTPTLEDALRRCAGQKYLLFTISSDVAFYPEEQNQLERLLDLAGIKPLHITVHSSKGHDSFLLEPELYTPHITCFLERTKQ